MLPVVGCFQFVFSCFCCLSALFTVGAFVADKR